MACTTTTTKDNNQTKNFIMEEAAYGVLNSPAGTLEEMRVTSNGLQETGETVRSEEIRSDRNVQEYVQVARSVAGDIGADVSYGSHDRILEGLLQNDWTASVNYSASTISITGSTGGGDLQLEDSATGFVVADFPVGKWIRVTGFTGANANVHYARVRATATTGAIPISSPTLVAEAAGDSVTLKNSGMLRNGTCFKSYTIEKEEIDTSDFYYWLGCVFGSAQIEITPQAIFKMVFSILGKSETRAAATIGNGSPTAQTTSGVMNTTSNLLYTLDDNATASWSFTDFNITLDNAARQDVQSGSLTVKQINLGDFTANATVSIYNTGNEALYTRYKGQTTHSYSFIFNDLAGNAYVFSLQKAKVSSALNPQPGLNTTRMLEVAFQGQYDADTQCTFQIDRISA